MFPQTELNLFQQPHFKGAVNDGVSGLVGQKMVNAGSDFLNEWAIELLSPWSVSHVLSSRLEETDQVVDEYK